MKLFMKLLLTLLVLAVLAPFTILKDEAGRPLMSLTDLKMPDVDVPAISDEVPGSSVTEDVIYQWKDADGNLHFTTAPPPEGVEYTERSFDPNANVIQAVKPKAASEVANGGDAEVSSESAEGIEEGKIGNPYTPEKIEKLVKDAKDVQKKLNERYQKQQEILENL